MKKMFFMILIAIATISCSKDDPIPVEPTPTATLTISSETVDYDSHIIVTWNSTNAKTVTLNGETVATSGYKDYSNMISTTKFLLTATNVTKTTSVEKTVTVGIEPAPVITLTASPSDAVLPYGKKVTISWSVTNAKNVTLDGVSVQATGTKEFQPFENTTYTLKAINVTKETTSSKLINVSAWNTTRFGLLTHNGKKWILLKTEVYNVNGYAYTSQPSANHDLGQYYIFGTDYQYTWRGNNSPTTPIVVDKWEFLENETKIKTHYKDIVGYEDNFFIITLNETDLSVSYDQHANNGSYVIYFFKTE